MSEMTDNQKRWKKQALNEKGNITHVLDVCDSWDYSHYPVFVKDTESVSEVQDKYNGKDMQSVYGTYEIQGI